MMKELLEMITVLLLLENNGKEFTKAIEANKEFRLKVGWSAFKEFSVSEPGMVKLVVGLVKAGVEPKSVGEMIGALDSMLGDNSDGLRIAVVSCMAECFRSVIRECKCADCAKWRATHDTKTG